MYTVITLFAYLIDRIFGEFSFIKHPVSYMGDYILWFESRYYRDSVWRGVVLVVSLLVLTFGVVDGLELLVDSFVVNPWIQVGLYAVIASMSIASRMLHDAVNDLIDNPHRIQYLVSRDTQNLTPSDVNKAGIETYAENLSDGVIAPLLYLWLFGLKGAFLYKAINTLDSMVGYRHERYERFGKVAAYLDDVANYLPARITAVLIALLMGSKEALHGFYAQGKSHDSPNAGHPIAAMGLALGVKLGGDTFYFGKLKKKAIFGTGKGEIEVEDIQRSLALRWRLDLLIVLTLGVLLWI